MISMFYLISKLYPHMNSWQTVLWFLNYSSKTPSYTIIGFFNFKKPYQNICVFSCCNFFFSDRSCPYLLSTLKYFTHILKWMGIQMRQWLVGMVIYNASTWAKAGINRLPDKINWPWIMPEQLQSQHPKQGSAHSLKTCQGILLGRQAPEEARRPACSPCVYL